MKSKCSSFKLFFFMAFILGWYLNFLLALRIWSSNWSGFIDGSPYGGMFKLDTTFENKSFRVDEIFSSSFHSNSFSISVILEKYEFFVWKQRLYRSPEIFIVSNLLMIKIVIVVFYCFSNKTKTKLSLLSICRSIFYRSAS